MSHPISGAPISSPGSTKVPLVGRTVTWTSSVPGVCAAPANGTTDANGQVAPVLTMLAAGTTNLQATCEGKTSNVVVVVATAPAAVSTVTVSPASLSGLVGSSGVLSAVVKDSLGNVLSGRTVSWSTSNAAVAVAASGNGATITANFLSAGTTNFQAWCEGVGSNVVMVTVSASAAPVASVTIAPTTLAGTVGGSGQLSAVVKDSLGNILAGRTNAWASSAPTVAAVTSPGQTATVSYLAAGSAQITANCEGVDSNAAVVTVSASAPNPNRPNEPAGFTRIAETAFAGASGAQALPNGTYATSGFGILAGRLAMFNPQSSGGIIALDATAPASPSPCFQFCYPAGLGCGQGIGSIVAWDTLGFGVNQYSRYYEADWVKIPSATFENQPGQVKLMGYWGVGNTNLAGADLYSTINGSTGNQFSLDVRMQNVTGWVAGANVNPAIFTCNQWTRIEWLFGINDVGVANGTLDVWINGVHTHHYTDRVFRTLANPNKFYKRQWDPIYGGACAAGTVRATTNFLWVDHIYVSGVL